MTSDTDTSPPPAAGVRRPWADVPVPLRAAVEERLGSRVVHAATRPGGFSPGVAARLELADGRRAFVKALGPEPNPDAPEFHRREARVAAALPPSAPAPRLLGSFEDAGWVVLLFENVDGEAPAQPWRSAELRRVLDAVADLAAALTPAPTEAAAAVPAAEEAFAGQFGGWRELAAQRAAGDPLDGLAPWASARLDELAGLESGWPEALAGDTLAHADLRADNLLLTSDQVFVVDWPHACLSVPWLDLLGMLPSVRMQGGPPPDPLFTAHPVARGADPRAVDAALAALAGLFVENSRRPAPPGLPTLRPFQAAQGAAALEWLRARREPDGRRGPS